MKFTILLLALAAVVALVNPTPVDVGKAARANLIVGNIGVADRRLTSAIVQRPAIANQIQTEDVAYRAAWNVNITSIRAWEMGASQGAQAWIVQGGIGRSYATVRFTSQRGRGYYYQLEFWGR